MNIDHVDERLNVGIIVLADTQHHDHNIQDSNGDRHVECLIHVTDRTLEWMPERVTFFQLFKQRFFIVLFGDDHVGIGMKPLRPYIVGGLFGLSRSSVGDRGGDGAGGGWRADRRGHRLVSL